MSRPHTEGHADFEARLSRLQAVKKPGKRSTRQSNGLWVNLGYTLTFVWAACWGVLGGVATRLVQYHGQGLAPQVTVSPEQYLIDCLIALVTILALRAWKNDITPHHFIALMVGVFSVTLMFHNLAHWYPEEMALLFSDNWVFQMRRASVEGSFALFGGFVRY